MTPQIEDWLGRWTMLLVFGLLLGLKLTGLAASLSSGSSGAMPWLALLEDLLGLAFLALVLVMTARRAPASRGPGSIEARITAVAGTFALMGLVALPAGNAPLAVQLGGVALMALGLAGSIHALWHLGRAFSIAPTSRRLVTSGPYGVVRHPLYLTEAITATGLVLTHWSWPAILLGAVQFALQYRRIGHEEAVLAAGFPDAWPAYAARVPQLVPRLHSARAG
jgi:protein-S-isoprenylcysteine O-methyltransferase Ste14